MPEVGSTNEALRAMAVETRAGTALVAGVQHAGRGRRGRSWLAPADGALALSLLLRPQITLSSLPLIVLAAGVATVRACGRPFRLKWPNDVLDLEGRKIAGILAEAELRPGGALDWVVLGIGINVGVAPEGPFSAGCLADSLGDAPDRSVLAVDIIQRVCREVTTLEADPAAVIEAWRGVDGTLGRSVRVEGVEGTAVGIGPDGALEVLDAAGQGHRILAGDVEMVRSL